jgi:hypothetical protein
MGVPQFGAEENKKRRRGAGGAGKWVYTGAKRKVYSCFPARAGSLKLSLFLLG